MFHAFLGEKLKDWTAAATLVRKIAENYKLPYYTISPTYSVCKNHGYLSGEVKVCPECGATCEVYSRITGYYRPVKNWNDGKAQEFKERKTYVVDGIVEKEDRDKPNEYDEVPILVTTKTCPKCKEAEKMLIEHDIFYMKMLAADNLEFVDNHNIVTAPTLVVGNKEYIGLSGIVKYIYEKEGWIAK